MRHSMEDYHRQVRICTRLDVSRLGLTVGPWYLALGSRRSVHIPGYEDGGVWTKVEGRGQGVLC